jgi:hypothetical protein
MSVTHEFEDLPKRRAAAFPEITWIRRDGGRPPIPRCAGKPTRPIITV